jgi:aspartyl-tRNA(Asn)/glutamyl-tRNA(Gln) amidotransferase subunit A
MAARFPTRRETLTGATLLAMAGGRGAAFARDGDLTDLSVAEAARRIAAGALSPTALTRAYLDRVEALNGAVNAYITVTAEAAMAEARSLEAELAAGRRRGPLHGVPIALKDNIDTRDVRTTAASAVYADRVPEQDAEVVRRLRAAGAVFLGKLNMHEFAFGGSSAETHFGPVRNPWNRRFIPGGSSGGSAAAVAARMCAAALGTDTAASIRYPAACCGVVGFKATYGLASIRGIIPLSVTVDHVGPIARTVEDAALLMQAIAGYDPDDIASTPAQAPDFVAAIGRNVGNLRVGVVRTPFFEGVEPELVGAVEAALQVIARLGANVRDVELPLVSVADFFTVAGAEIVAYHAGIMADATRRERYRPSTLRRLVASDGVPVRDYIAARQRMEVARKTIGRAFANVDVVVTPTVMIPPFTIEAALNNPPDEMLLIRNTLHFNSLGLPAISVPCGFTSAGLPIGLHIAGPPLADGPVLSLAHAYERATAWSARRPRL